MQAPNNYKQAAGCPAVQCRLTGCCCHTCEGMCGMGVIGRSIIVSGDCWRCSERVWCPRWLWLQRPALRGSGDWEESAKKARTHEELPSTARRAFEEFDYWVSALGHQGCPCQQTARCSEFCANLRGPKSPFGRSPPPAVSRLLPCNVK